MYRVVHGLVDRTEVDERLLKNASLPQQRRDSSLVQVESNWVHSFSLSHAPVADAAMVCALREGLRARELDIGTKAFGRVEVRAADQKIAARLPRSCQRKPNAQAIKTES